MCILALFTSGYNIVGTGDWEYRLGRVVLRHSPPPLLRSGRQGGGGVIVNTDLSLSCAPLFNSLIRFLSV